MKYNTWTLLWALSATMATAQTKVEKAVPTKASGEGVTYFLPKTSLVVNVAVTKATVKAGPYYRYAERYLAIKNVATEDHVYYELERVTCINKGVPDTGNRYRIEFKQKTVAPFAYLTHDGLLCAINEEYTPEAIMPDEEEIKPERKAATLQAAAVYTEELLMAGSVARQAEVVARQIYHLRESRMDILTGDADNLPPDGEAMKIVISKLEEQEKALISLFTGTETRETLYFDVSILPEDELDREILFRFSSKLGMLDEDDLGGEPVYMNLAAVERAPESSPKDQEKRDKAKSIVYNVPGRGRIEIVFKNRVLLKKEMPVVQFGTQETLAPAILEDKKQPVKILFYPETGAIRQIKK